MNKLLSANFMRLSKNKIFYLAMIFMFCLGLWAVIMRYKDIKNIPDYPFSSPDGLLFTGSMFISIIIAVFIGIFVGTEYSDGTIRNKLIIGHSRIKVYLSNLIVCITAAFLIHLMYIAVIVCLGIPIIGKFEIPAKTLIPFILCSFFTVAALSAIFLLISMIIHSKAAAAVSAIILSIVFIMSALSINEMITAPEYYQPYAYFDESGTIQQSEPTKNPRYLTGSKRAVYQTLYDLLPVCQFLQISETSDELIKDGKLTKFSLNSFSIIVITTGAGVILFRNKDLK